VNTTDREIIVVKIFPSVPNNGNYDAIFFIVEYYIRLSDLSHTTTCRREDGSAVSPAPDPRGSLSAAIPTKAITELINKCRMQPKAWLELGKHNPCMNRPALPFVIGSYICQSA